MRTKRLLALLVTGLLAAAPTIQAQQSSETDTAMRQADEQRRQAEKQMKDAERQMRDAERQMREAARVIARTASDRARREVERHMIVYADHPRIGVILRTDADPKVDAIGAEIEGLTPGGSAEDAGVKVGDIVMKANGKSLTAGTVAVDDDESAPSARLRELVSGLKAGDKVALEIKRGNEVKSITVTAEKLGGPMLKVLKSSGPDDLDFDFNIDVDVDMDKGPRWEKSTCCWWEMELTSLNPELGEYFGSSDGLLVTRAPKDDTLKLKAGDVILTIGNRALSSPSQALRVLRSYDKGETITIEVLRRKEKLTLTAQAPESIRHGIYFVQSPPPPAPPAPAAAPAAAAAPAPPAPPVPPAKVHHQAA
ncbi:MAG TPA: PDZ domain-containing protein [Thermoanaerobaculaceae bacterium]|nr:PDZ domain-containing protein [Thermoanaerobaculaceae bacterium]HPS77232.1 PDZ domain-containing protein [Thermoanaerobaculaceae bacterium]